MQSFKFNFLHLENFKKVHKYSKKVQILKHFVDEAFKYRYHFII